MPHPTLPTFFFAGTDTDVGKTYVAALVARRMRQLGKRVGVYKPVASGCRRQGDQWIADDALALWNAADRPRTLEDVCPQKFVAPLAPPAAAAAEGRSVNRDLLRRGAEVWQTIDFDVLIVEGAGGLMSPIAAGMLNSDLVNEFSAPIVWIVAANRLGVIHQTLATCAAAQHRGIQPAGIILSTTTADRDASVAGNAAEIASYCDVPVLAELPYNADVEDATFVDAWLKRL